MEVILREHVDNLGRRGEIVKVADGYARNYLLPRKLALLVDRRQQEADRARAASSKSRKPKSRRSQAEASRSGWRSVEIEIARRVGETDALYGSVTTATSPRRSPRRASRSISRKIQLPEPIKKLGEVHGAGEAAPRRHGAASRSRSSPKAALEADVSASLVEVG